MSPKLYGDGMGGKGMTAGMFADLCGINRWKMRKMCEQGRIDGARFHPLTKAWWIYPPAKLLCQPEKRQPGGTTQRGSISPGVVLV